MERLQEFIEHNTLLSLAFAVVLGIFIFTEIQRARRPYREVGPAEATRLINDGALVLDLRDPAAFKKGHIAGAVNFPSDRLEGQLDEIRKRAKKAAGRPLVIYDEHGMGVSASAGKLAGAELGGEIVSLKGGVHAWKGENLPLKKG